MIRRPPRSTPLYSSAASDVYKRQYDFWEEMVFIDMQPILGFRALEGHAWSYDLREAVDVHCLDIELLFYLLPQGLRPGLSSKDTDAQREVCYGYTHVFRDFVYVQCEAGGGAKDCGFIVLHKHELLLGVAPGNGDDGCAQALSAVVRSQPAGKQSIAIGVLKDILISGPGAGQSPRHDLRPGVYISPRVSDRGRLT